MSFRTVVITSAAKLSYKDGHLIVRADEAKMIHLSEIGVLLIDSTMVTLTSYLLCELVKQKIKVIFCDELRNPISELLPYYGSHNSSKRLSGQILWDDESKGLLWTAIIRRKIRNQAAVLSKIDFQRAEMLSVYADEVQFDDMTNREGHAAKVYFNGLFGMEFVRDAPTVDNAALNYGYALILSSFNKEIVSRGYLTQLGIHHRNEFNHYNLSCDLMEPFRPFVDALVASRKDEAFDSAYKLALLKLLDAKATYFNREYRLRTAIAAYVRNITDFMDRRIEYREELVDIRAVQDDACSCDV
jgi:CRISPR-associated protein Cas1